MKLMTDIALVILGFATLFCVIFGACLEHENPFADSPWAACSPH